MSDKSVQDLAFEAVDSIGGCGAISPDGTRICILDRGHDRPHGWLYDDGRDDHG
jgi:hypothetical protein